LETLLECAELAMQPDSPDSSTGWFEAEIQRTISQIHAAGSEDENKRFDNERFDVELGKVLQFARDRGPIVAHEAEYALKQMGSVALMGLDWVSSSRNPRYRPIELTQDRAGLRLGSVRPALDMWR